MITVSGDAPAIRSALLAFFDEHARVLPWREDADPYRVWVSEIMLQQTRVETVVPYYDRWMSRFPTVTALAEAPLDSVLEAWAGLGYYSRARNLHRAAGIVREVYAGGLPDDVHLLKALPGIGEYTAGAIASIAFNQPHPAVDGNVRRVLSRLFDLEDPTPAKLRAHATDLVAPQRPGDLNQALMELGATVCTPRTPTCPECPLTSHCRALAAGTIQERPPVRAKGAVPKEDHAVAIPRLWIDGLPWALLRRRPPTGLLGGMLEFPGQRLPDGFAASKESDQELGAAARSVLGTVVTRVPDAGIPLDPLPHRFTHLEITYHPFLFDIDGKRVRISREPDIVSITWPELATAALPAAQRRIAVAAETVTPTGRMQS